MEAVKTVLERSRQMESAEIIDKFSCFVIKQAGKYRIPSYDFDDLVQQGYLSVIRAINLYKIGRGSFTIYCTNAVINNFKALLKGETKHLREVQNDSIIDLKRYDFTLEDEVIAYDEAQKVKNALDKLEVIERDIIKLVYIEGKTLKEEAVHCDLNYRKAIEIKKEAYKCTVF